MDFNFTVSGMTKEQAEFLLDLIVRVVSFFGLEMGGGYVQKDS